MPCLVGLFAYFVPRIVMFVMWLTGDYLGRAYHTTIWPLLGFLFMPYTTLAYAFAQNSFGGVQGLGLVIYVMAILLDLGFIGGGAHRARRGRERRTS